jgi:hypothetical protein
VTSFQALFLKALLITTTTEFAAGIALKLLGGKLGFANLKKIKIPKFAVGIFMASMLTLPYIWFIFYAVIKDRMVFTIVAELWAWLIEAIFYRYYFDLKISRALLFSLILNAFSFVLGLLFFTA